MVVALAVIAAVGSRQSASAASAPAVGVDIEFSPGEDGYWVLDDFGRVFALGGAAYWGGSPPLDEDESAVAMGVTPGGAGYRIFTSKGRVVVYGDAVHLGDMAGQALNEGIVDGSTTSSGNGYYLLGADGGIFAFGDAAFHGSIQGIVNGLFSDGRLATSWLDAPIVGIAPTSSGRGYWLTAADGGMFSFGDAEFHGSVPEVLPAGTDLAAPIVGTVPQGFGYLLVAVDGGIFNFGSSQFHGSIPGLNSVQSGSVVAGGGVDITAVTVTADRSGYSMLDRDGVIWPFGSVATSLGAIPSADLAIPPDPGDIRDCADFTVLIDAQQWFDHHRPFHGDVALLDGDNDGRACGADPIQVEPGLKVALIGDSGIGPNATAVLELIRDQGADLVIHLGDFDYRDNPAAFESSITGVLGSDFPYFAAVGNHDVPRWSEYRQDLLDRLSRVAGASCSGDYGVNARCTYRGLSFILSGVGTHGSGHEEYLVTQLSGDRYMWRLCAWHKNQTATQVGAKTDEVGWAAFETCRENGTIVVNGHEHSYSRTKTLTNITSQSLDPEWSAADNVRVGPGSTFVVVSGLGGRSIRPQLRCLPATPPYGCNGEWAAISSASNGALPGALFLELNVDGDPRRGRGTFVDINGDIIDSFVITSEN